MPYMLKLADERGEQLKMIADREGKTVADVVTDAIRAKIDAGVIPAALPGVYVAKADENVTIEMQGFSGEVSAIEAAKLADSLREAGTSLSPADVERKQRWLEGLGALSGIKVERMASGVRLVSPITGQKYPLTFGVASDLADQIEREIAE